MSASAFQLEHLNLPARDPVGLAAWYAHTFDLHADAHKVCGPGVLIAFQAGEPVNRASDLHVGFRVPSLIELEQWAGKFGAQVKRGEEYTAFRTLDPEGNCVEIYCPNP